ncbi:hypothetical protein GCM10009602_37910 [Nocardiopsis tropica]
MAKQQFILSPRLSRGTPRVIREKARRLSGAGPEAPDVGRDQPAWRARTSLMYLSATAGSNIHDL